jgi:hypothetical protein
MKKKKVKASVHLVEARHVLAPIKNLWAPPAKAKT